MNRHTTCPRSFASLGICLPSAACESEWLVVLDRQLHVFQEHRRFVLGVFVQSDLTDPQHAGTIEELRDHRDDFARQRDVLGFLGVDAQPTVMLDAKLSRSFGVDRGELFEVIAKTVDRAAVKTGPEPLVR